MLYEEIRFCYLIYGQEWFRLLFFTSILLIFLILWRFVHELKTKVGRNTAIYKKIQH